MYFKFIRTKHECLKKYLEGFYIFQPNTEKGPLEYIIFPSNHIVLSIYKNTSQKTENRKISITKDPESSLLSLAAFGFIAPISFAYQYPVREITFCFNPLGFNHFLSNDLKSYFKEDIFSFLPFDDYEQKMLAILEEKDEQKLQQQVEDYWLSKLSGKDFSILEKTITLLQDKQANIQQIAEELHLSRQHLNRLFHNHFCKSPAQFKKIARFRQTLENRVRKASTIESLTSLTYESLFYDQSHLIKDFKALTGMSPQKFFSKNRSFEHGRLNWFFPE